MLQKLRSEDAICSKCPKKGITPRTHSTNTVKPCILKRGCGFFTFSDLTKLCAKRGGVKKKNSVPPMPKGLCNSKFPKGVRPRSSKEAFLWWENKLKRARTFPKQKLTRKSDMNHCAWWLIWLWTGRFDACQVSVVLVLPGSTSLLCRSSASHSSSSLHTQRLINGEVLHWSWGQSWRTFLS